MNRRAFIAGLGGAAVWVAPVRAQQGDRMRRIAVLVSDSATTQHRFAALRQRLAELSWVEGTNLRIDTRNDVSDPERNEAERRQLVADLVRGAPDVIISANPTLRLLQQATRTIPVVFVLANDPLAEGYIASLARPGGNLTGLSFFNAELVAKRLELLKELAPSMAKAAVLLNAANSAGESAHSTRAGADREGFEGGIADLRGAWARRFRGRL